MGYKFTYFMLAFFYLIIVFDIVAIAVLSGKDESKGEFDFLLTLFLLDRILAILFRVFKAFR